MSMMLPVCFCLHASDRHDRRNYVLRLSVCLILVNAISQERLQIWQNCPLGLEVELINLVDKSQG